MGFLVRVSTTIKIKEVDKLFTADESFSTYEEAYAYYKSSSQNLAKRASRSIKVELFNPYSVKMLSTYIHPKKEDTTSLRAARLKDPRTLQKLRANEIKALLVLFNVLKNLFAKEEFKGNTAAAMERILSFIDTLTPRLNSAVDNKDPVVQITYSE